MMTTKLEGTSLRELSAELSARDIIEAMDSDGGVIIKNFISEELVNRLNNEFNTPLQDLDAGSKNENQLFADFHGANTKRLTNLITHSATFRKYVLDHDLLHALGEGIYREECGDWWLTTAQVIEIGPGNKAQGLHRDMENFAPFVKMGKNAPTVTVNLLIALTEFTEENGATRIIPGSQHWDDYETERGHPEQTIPVLMKAGDAVLFSGKVVHGGGANVTSGEYRRGLTVPMQPAYLTPEEAYPFIIDVDLAKSLSQRAQRLIGFRSLYPMGSPGLWQNNYEEIANYLGLDR